MSENQPVRPVRTGSAEGGPNTFEVRRTTPPLGGVSLTSRRAVKTTPENDLPVRPEPNQSIRFTVLGTPKPQGSKRAYVQGGHARLVESAGQPLKDWRTDVQQAAIKAHHGEPLEGPLAVQLIFNLVRPKSHPKTRPTWPTARPDIDKLARAVLDALTHVCYQDDSQITHLTLAKVWGDPPGVTVTIWEAT